MNFDLSATERKEIWDYLSEQLELFYSKPYNRKVSPELNVEEIRDFINPLSASIKYKEAIEHVLSGMEKYMVHTSHPMYYGLFNPRANFPSAIADTIVAIFNPQLAAWSHAPFAAEAEAVLLQKFGGKFGYSSNEADGVFTSGGAEANLTALLASLNNKFPEYANEGLRSLLKQPVIYCTEESHHSLIKAARVAGLGINAVRKIPINDKLQSLLPELESLIDEDIKTGLEPLMIIATMGTTGAGIIDPVKDFSAIAVKYDMWLHADAAYGGGAILSGRYRQLLAGIELADSITFDAHKWMSVTMCGSMFLTRHKEILDKTFSITTGYMPKEAGNLNITDAFTHSIQWSRRFIGLKVYLSVLIFGWQGYEETIDHQFLMGKLLREKLKKNDWIIFNETDLPIICFGKKYFMDDANAALRLSNTIIQSGKAWVSVYKVNEVNTLRICITNYLTGENDLDNLIALLKSID